tara:strand:+ start:218 stop:745 length:528 start_codon:yes stop_codon:yes gene_type:complete
MINTDNKIIAHTLGLGSLSLPTGRALKFLKSLYRCDLTKEEALTFASEAASAFNAESLSGGQGWSSGTVMVSAKNTSLGEAVSACMAKHSSTWNRALRNPDTTIEDLIAMASTKVIKEGEPGAGEPRLNYRFMLSQVVHGVDEQGENSKAYEHVKGAFMNHMSMTRRQSVIKVAA